MTQSDQASLIKSPRFCEVDGPHLIDPEVLLGQLQICSLDVAMCTPDSESP